MPDRTVLRAAAERVRALPPALAVFLWSRPLIWTTAIYAWVWFVPRPGKTAELLRSRVRDGDLGARRLGLVPVDRAARATSGTAAKSSIRSTRSRSDSSAVSSAGTTSPPASSSHSPAARPHSSCSTSLRCRGSVRTGLVARCCTSRSFPMSLFLQAVYSESLYLLLCVGAFLLAERRRVARRRHRHRPRDADSARRLRAVRADPSARVAFPRAAASAAQASRGACSRRALPALAPVADPCTAVRLYERGRLGTSRLPGRSVRRALAWPRQGVVRRRAAPDERLGQPPGGGAQSRVPRVPRPLPLARRRSVAAVRRPVRPLRARQPRDCAERPNRSGIRCCRCPASAFRSSPRSWRWPRLPRPLDATARSSFSARASSRLR